MSDKVHLEITQGEELYQEFRLLDDDRNPVDLTNATLTVRKHADIADLTLAVTKEANTGVFTLASTASTLSAEPGIFGLQVWAAWSDSTRPNPEVLVDARLAIKEAVGT